MASSPDQKSNVNFSCLSALRSSYLSLTSIRLLRVAVNHSDPEDRKASSNFSHFQKLLIMSFDAGIVLLLARSLDIILPPGLKVINIPYYYSQLTIREDMELARFLMVRSYPGLKMAVVPSSPILRDGVASDSDDFKKLWLEGRRELEKAEVFQSGKVKLRILELGESSEYPTSSQEARSVPAPLFSLIVSFHLQRCSATDSFLLTHPSSLLVGEPSGTDFMPTLTWLSSP